MTEREKPTEADSCPNCRRRVMFMGHDHWVCLDCRVRFPLDVFKKRRQQEHMAVFESQSDD